MRVSETGRLILRALSMDEANVVLRLLNEPSFLRYVGDKGVRTIEDAREYLATGPLASYERHGFGLYLTKPPNRPPPSGPGRSGPVPGTGTS